MKSETDETLVAMYANGNNDAFDALLERYKQTIHSYIYFSVRDYDLTEDLFQETFMKVITTIRQGRYTESGRFKAWITRIAHNLIIDHFRQERNENTISNDEVAVDLFNDMRLSDKTIEELLVNNQVFEDIKKMIRYLPANQREVLEMRYYEELSFKEIAARTSVSINTALGRMRYAILNMRRMMAENRIELSLCS